MIDASILSELSSLGLTGPQYQAVLSILSRIETRADTLRAKGRERTSRWRHRNVNVTRHEPPKEKNQTPPPVANATATIWMDCVPLLTSLGLQERTARSNIGRWLKTNPEQDVRKAVSAAAQAGTGDPIPYITKALKSMAKSFAPLSFRAEPEKISNDEWRRARGA